MRGKDHGECLTEETLAEYLEGVLDPAIKAASEVHLIACDDCRDRLGFFMRLLDEEIAIEESQKVQAITVAWEKRKHTRHVPRRTGTLPVWLFGFVAVAAVFILGVLSIRSLGHRPELKSASEVVQLLLARQRPFESRMANEPHLPIVRTRGVEDPGVVYGLVASEMTRLSADAHQMGRFYLLQKDFGRAVQYLEIAEKEVGAAPGVHSDLGVAYMESGDPKRIDRAAEEFRHALDLDPAFTPAVFNLALLYERTNATMQAEAQWKRYLKLDSKSDWAKEAQTRLQGLSR